MTYPSLFIRTKADWLTWVSIAFIHHYAV